MKKNENHPSQGKTPKQYSKQLIITALSAILSIAVLAVATAAWFANNRDVNASGMKIQVDTMASLVIHSDETQIASDPQTVVNFTNDTNAPLLSPATHAVTSTSNTFLKYYNEPSSIDIKTGYGSNSDDKYTEVPLNSHYYRDYVVYIASVGEAFTNQDLKVTMTLTLMTSDGKAVLGESDTKDYMKAASIDFYVGDTIDNSTYKGTLNAAGIDSNGGAKTELILLTKGTIPLCTGTPLKVTMRCYFDGALQKTAASDNNPAVAYVRSAGLSIDDFSILVTFNAPAPSTPSTP